MQYYGNHQETVGISTGKSMGPEKQKNSLGTGDGN